MGSSSVKPSTPGFFFGCIYWFNVFPISLLKLCISVCISFGIICVFLAVCPFDVGKELFIVLSYLFISVRSVVMSLLSLLMLFASLFFLSARLKFHQFCWSLKRNYFWFCWFCFSIFYFTFLHSNHYFPATASFSFSWLLFFSVLKVYNCDWFISF